MDGDLSRTVAAGPRAIAVGRWFRIGAFVVSTILLLARLGHYALWDDEAFTALAAKAVARTGDTSLLIDHNVVLFREGLVARDLYDRSTPPLSAYLGAPFVGRDGTSATAARLPFAFCGIAAIGVMLWWAGRASVAVQVAFALGVAANVSLLLYFRQCRYYAPAILLTVAVAWCYINWSERRGRVLLTALLSVLLFAANYMNWVALHACLLLDYLVWQRRQRAITVRTLLLLVSLVAVGCGAIAAVWNPLRTRYAQAEPNSLAERWQLFLWYWRDLNTCELAALALLALAAILAIRRPGTWLSRGVVAIVGYIVVISAMSPQVVAYTAYSDIRYIAPLIPLLILISAMVLSELGRGQLRWVLPLAALAFTTNVFHGGTVLPVGLRFTPAAYAKELIHPAPDPYGIASAWVRGNVRAGESVWVLPAHAAYPLMYHAPDPVYAWQLSPANPDPQFASLPLIHFQTHQAPDYVIVFGPKRLEVVPVLNEWAGKGVRYEHIATLDCFWQDRYRPEFFLRSFGPVRITQPETELIYVYRHATGTTSGG